MIMKSYHFLLEREIDHLLKIANVVTPNLSGNRRVFLQKLNVKFDQLGIDRFEDFIRDKLQRCLDSLQNKGLNNLNLINPEQSFNYLKQFSDNAKSSHEILKNSLNLSDQALNDNNQYLLILKSIRDLFFKDVDIISKRKIGSYFENYSKFLDHGQLLQLAQIVEMVQNEISLMWSNYINIGKDPFRNIIKNPNYNLDSLIDTNKQYLRELEFSSDGVGLAGSIHTLHTVGGGKVTSKKISDYCQSNSLLNKDFADLNKNLSIFNSILDTIEIDLSFSNIEDFKLKYSKLEAYSQITDDNSLLLNFIHLVRAFNRSDKEPILSNTSPDLHSAFKAFN